ncbi:MAG TPA: SH3-like domain-containing protein [Geminicoccus sp.]|jgi:nitrile hydratase|uniref:SH3-like domain-containing protein n=1 Tax=Geminicoccus sp. TaxID=2024832 RepID=UPI002E35EFDC|nr:SH3-like domain-containing protein [Geminicoccus sp.]HEX2525340.1 SH3-like domain-containing protein [Geminicoccus sp.]
MTLKKGDHVRVLHLDPPGHHRTPSFVRGREGIVEALAGRMPDAEMMAYGRRGVDQPVWRVRFRQAELWPDYEGEAGDAVIVDLYEHWLEPLR